MTIGEAIERANRESPNMTATTDKVKWLNVLDWKIWREVFETHHRGWDEKPRSFTGYGEKEPQSTALLVPPPFDEDIYIHYLKAKIAQVNGEAGRYNQEITLYNEAFDQFAADFNKRHMPRQAGRFRF